MNYSEEMAKTSLPCFLCYGTDIIQEQWCWRLSLDHYQVRLSKFHNLLACSKSSSFTLARLNRVALPPIRSCTRLSSVSAPSTCLVNYLGRFQERRMLTKPKFYNAFPFYTKVLTKTYTAEPPVGQIFAQGRKAETRHLCEQHPLLNDCPSFLPTHRRCLAIEKL